MGQPLTARFIALQVLLAGQNYGGGIVEVVSAATAGRVALLDGCVYPALRALEAEGMIRSAGTMVPPSGCGARRKMFELTPEGRRRALIERVDSTAICGLMEPRESES